MNRNSNVISAKPLHRLAVFLLAGALMLACGCTQPTVTVVPPASCYTLTLGHSGEGSDPVASPANSPGCSPGSYTAGATISLSGAAAITDWKIKDWTGTSNDASTAGTNTLTMPSASLATAVNYIPSSGVNIEGTSFDVKRELDQAWATLTNPLVFDALTTSDWKGLVADGLVVADSLGQAQLCPHNKITTSGQCSAAEACNIYVFWASKLKYSSCTESASNTTCLFDGQSSFRNCPVKVETLSANVQGLGTWYSVTYLSESQMTVVLLFEGTVTLTPVTALNFSTTRLPAVTPEKGQDLPALDSYQVSQREVGETRTGQIDPGTGSLLVYYTAPDAKLLELGLNDPPSGARQWQGIDRLDVLRERLRLVEPNLEPWLQGVWQTAALDGIKLPSLAPLAPERGALTITGYGTLADLRYANALAYGVEWQQVVNTLGFAAPVMINGADVFRSRFKLIGDVSSLGYDPNRAVAFLREAGFSGANASLSVLLDDTFQKKAGMIQAELDKIGFQTEISVVPRAELSGAIQSRTQQRIPFLVIELR